LDYLSHGSTSAFSAACTIFVRWDNYLRHDLHGGVGLAGADELTYLVNPGEGAGRGKSRAPCLRGVSFAQPHDCELPGFFVGELKLVHLKGMPC
jgi:hypothetical protein